VVLDRVLPRLQAEEVAQRLRDNAATRAIPLFVLASEGDLGSRAALFEACIPKPLDRVALVAGLGALPGRRLTTSTVGRRIWIVPSIR
jgi:DNA-binding response OmpR family regulator